ncbi:MAG: RNA 2',3'-cyclic phosphodiesterase [Anaerolineales bacterium]|jgi:2'-5' RNA ligase
MLRSALQDSHPTTRVQVFPAVIRAFIAVELPWPLQNYLAELSGRLFREVPPQSVRWARPDGIHLTLKFLGAIAESRLAEIDSLLEPRLLETTPFLVEVGGLGCFPDLGRPRVVWVGVRSPTGELEQLQEAIEKSLSEIGFPREARGYSGHLTLGRVRQDIRRPELKQVGEAVARIGEADHRILEIRGISLFQSDLRPDGAVYTRRREWRLREAA